ncbi:MAG TPA: threonine synthase [Firmicutes bacterium]|nr:threonine synthase [Bacillota bacterium]
MRYNSTRNSGADVSAAAAIARGISPEGGLYVPADMPRLSDADFDALRAADYAGRARLILSRFLTDFTDGEIADSVAGAYTGGRFDDDQPAPLVQLEKGVHILELWHGPTCAFKDLALQILPHLLTRSAKKMGDGKKTVILVATSGDTGKAALEGFKDVPDTEILVFYPEDGVSPMQKLQMTTQEGANVFVAAIRGNFDDAQTGVKKIFTDPAVGEKLAAHNMAFSSANSINWGRLVPQVVYYVSAYCDLVNQGADLSDGFDVVVPTGNFGNILAAYYAKCMGVPIARLVCASNANNVLTDFLTTGTYDRNRQFYTTISPSMDILVSSNLERLLYHMTGRDDKKVSGWMQALSDTGRYTVDGDIADRLRELFWAGCCDDTETKAVIREVYEKKGYLCDTHTAVAVGVYEKYKQQTGSGRPAVIASTASPFKFAASVLDALAPDKAQGSEFEMVNKLHEATGWKIPGPLAGLKGRAVRFDTDCEREHMLDVVYNRLGIR